MRKKPKLRPGSVKALDKNVKKKQVYGIPLLVERISPFGLKWYLHRDEPFVLDTLLDFKKHTPTEISRLIGKRYGKTSYKETVKSILFKWKKEGYVKHEKLSRNHYFWIEK